MKLILLLCAVVYLTYAEEEVLTSNCPEGQGLDYLAPNCHPCFEGWYDSFQSDNCIMCPDGVTHKMRGATDKSMCTMCEVGYMIDPEVPANCTVCPKGTYSLEIDSTSCTPCPKGQTTNNKGTADASFCHSCGVGQRFDEDRRMCVNCPHGYYATGKNGRCSSCPRGTRPPAGIIPATWADCSECWTGWGKKYKWRQCEICPKGTFGPGDSLCHECPEGMTTQRYGESKCIPACSAGEGWSTYLRKCVPCRQGYYSPDGKTEGCLWCPDGSSTEGTGATSLDQCSVKACSMGERWSVSLSKCLPCEQGRYSSNGKTPGCRPCPQGYTTKGIGTFSSHQCSVKM